MPRSSSPASVPSTRRTSRRGRSETVSTVTAARPARPASPAALPRRADVDDAHRLLVGVLGERVLEEGTCVAYGLGATDLRAVQVAESDVVEPRERTRRHLLRAADAEWALALALEAAGDERVGDQHVALLRLGGGARTGGAGRGDRLLIVDGRIAERGARLGRIGEGEGADAYRPVLVAQDDRARPPVTACRPRAVPARPGARSRTPRARRCRDCRRWRRPGCRGGRRAR